MEIQCSISIVSEVLLAFSFREPNMRSDMCAASELVLEDMFVRIGIVIAMTIIFAIVTFGACVVNLNHEWEGHELADAFS